MPEPPPICPTCGNPLPTPQALCPTCLLGQGHDLVAATSLKPGQFKPPPPEEIALLFPEFQVTELLGHGGMGAVYKAADPNLDRTVAIKILPPEAAADPEFTERFRREAAAMARLDHPNIVTLHSFGERQGFHYFIMEYVDGTDLARLLQQDPPSAADALHIASQVCDALNAAHAAGVVHRDIKPANILLTGERTVKLTDFGLAKLVAADAPHLDLTRTNTSLGTPRYMAPEQAEAGAGTTPDHRVDIYSLGVVLYELLTGQVPAGNFDPPSERNAEVNPDVDRLVLRAMDAEPSRRFQSARDLRTAIASTVAGKILTRAQHHRRTLFLTAVAAAVAAAFGAGVVVTTSLLKNTGTAPDTRVDFTVPGATPARLHATGALPDMPGATRTVVSVAVSSSSRPFAVALHPDGSLTAWGASNYGQTSIPDPVAPAVAVAAGQGNKSAHALALHHDGTVTGWGDNTYGQASPPAGLAGVTAIAAGEFHSLALHGDGTITAWGHPPSDVTGIPAGIPPAVAIASGARFATALHADGTVTSWGDTLAGPHRLQPATAIAAGNAHTLALHPDGGVSAWGSNSNGQCDVPGNLPPAVRVFAGANTSAALDANGTLHLWGDVPGGDTPAGVSFAALGTGCALYLTPAGK